MPSLSGPTLAARVQASRPEIKILFMSGYSGDLIQVDAVITRMMAYIQKPFSLADLVGRLDTLLDHTEAPAQPATRAEGATSGR